MVEDFAAAAYPGLDHIEKKHRVSILRAVRNAKLPDDHWWNWRSASSVKGVPYILINRLNLRSIGVGNERREGYVRLSDEAAERRAREPVSRTWPYILRDGPYPVLLEYYRACVAKDEIAKGELWEVYKGLIYKVIYARKSIEGELHPDFLKDCAA